MRIIRTELYFDEDQVSGYEMFRSRPPRRGEAEKNPGVAFLWIKREDGNLLEFDGSKDFRPIRRSRSQGHPGNAASDEVRGIIELFIRDADEDGFLRIPSDIRLENRALVDFVLAQQVVMEHSPPFSIAFKALLDQKNSPMWIGTFIGTGAGWERPVLLFITVPVGIIVVSSALGIGAAMQAGLNKSIKRLFDRSKPRLSTPILFGLLGIGV